MNSILVLGAYGLAGRAIVDRCVARTGYGVMAAGRSPERLNALCATYDFGRVTPLPLDVRDLPALRKAFGEAAFVINAVGPYAQTGATVARTCIESGKPYLDCANEQRHYRNLVVLDAPAREKGLPLVTGAGLFPGLSTLLTARVLKALPGATEAECCCAQFRHAYPDSGLASMMGGILEALEQPVAVREGKLVPVVMGRWVKSFHLPPPFARRRCIEVPTIDALTLPSRFALREFHTWFHTGDMPLWLLDVVRLMQPNRRPWAYRLIERIMRRINNRDTARAIAAGVGPECLLQVIARSGDRTVCEWLSFVDGAVPTACLPVHFADRHLRGEIAQTGLLTPLDVVDLEIVEQIADGAVLDAGRG